MNEALRRSAAHVFVDGLETAVVDTRLSLGDDDAHHLRRVVRLSASEVISVSDGHGRWAQARLDGDEAVVVSAVVTEAAPAPSCVVSAIPKGDRVDTLVEKLTELGVGSIVLADMARSVVRWDGDRAARQSQRLHRIVRQAAAQSRRVWLPELQIGSTFIEAIARPGAALADPSGRRVAPGSVSCLVVGPEGGFTEAEIAAASDVVSLADTVLRVETAAIVAGFLVGCHC